MLRDLERGGLLLLGAETADGTTVGMASDDGQAEAPSSVPPLVNQFVWQLVSRVGLRLRHLRPHRRVIR